MQPQSMGQQTPGWHQEKHCWQMGGGDPFSLPSTSEATPGALCSVLGSHSKGVV